MPPTPAAAPPQSSAADKVQWRALTPVIALTVISTFVVLARLYTRHFIVKAMGADDVVICVSLLLSWAVCGLTVAELATGIGGYVWTSVLDLLTPQIARLILSWNCVYVALLAVTKASILMQYLRLFDNCCKRLQVLTYVLLFALLPFLTYGIFGAVFLCRPHQKLFHMQTIAGHCSSTRSYWLSTAATNIALDFSVLVLPMPMLLRLRVPRRQKAGVLAVFLLGFFVCAVSLARVALVHTAVQRREFTDASVDAITWSAVEANTGIICASLLALKPLLQKFFPRLVPDDSRGADRGQTRSQTRSSGRATRGSVRTTSLTLQRTYSAQYELEKTKSVFGRAPSLQMHVGRRHWGRRWPAADIAAAAGGVVGQDAVSPRKDSRLSWQIKPPGGEAGDLEIAPAPAPAPALEVPAAAAVVARVSLSDEVVRAEAKEEYCVW